MRTRGFSRSSPLAALAATALVAATAGSAEAQLIVGNDQTGVATIYDVNPDTGVATPIYSSSGAEAKAWGMAYDPASNTLYWNNGGTLYSSPYQNPLVPQNRGSLTFNGAATNYVGLSFYNGTLYGTRNVTTEAVYRIDLGTLEGQIEYQYPSAFDFGGLEHDQATGKLYGLTDAAPAPDVRGLYEINTAAMSQFFRAPYPAGETDIDALAVNAGVAYYVTDGPNTTQPNFYRYSIATGQLLGTIPSPFTGSGTFSAATWAVIPEPATATASLLALGLLARRRAR